MNLAKIGEFIVDRTGNDPDFAERLLPALEPNSELHGLATRTVASRSAAEDERQRGLGGKASTILMGTLGEGGGSAARKLLGG